jgi:hypothetical protein
MSRKKKTPRSRKRRPVEFEGDGSFARAFDAIFDQLFVFPPEDLRPEHSAKVIDLNQRRKDKEGQD